MGEALAWARQQALSVDDELSYLREYEHISLASVLVHQYRRDRVPRSIDEVLGLLQRLLHAADVGGRKGSTIEILVQQALAHQARGDVAAGLDALATALAQAEPEGYTRVFLDEGEPMTRLLAAASSRGILPGYTGRLLDGHGSTNPFNGSALPGTAPNALWSLVEPLSRRELEVLRLVAEGRSNHEISDKLFLALSTVKGHNRTIFGKLGVQRRTEAVARARELGLL
jgi:LuxR family maltose regulon positive regulatory protein